MLLIDSESIKRVTNGDLIVRGNPEGILKRIYEEGWCVTGNLRESEELEVEKSGMIDDVSALVNTRRKLSYGEFIDNDWYILDAEMR